MAARSSSTRSAICRRKHKSRCSACFRIARSSDSATVIRFRWMSASSRRPTATWRRRWPPGTFRQDLFYRLNVFPIRVPSLRERAEDIPLLVEYLIERYATKAGKRIRKINRSTLTLFQAYDWPGNIRELQNVIERAVILCDGDTFSVDETWLAHDPKASEGPSIADRHLVGAAAAHPVGDRTTYDRGRSGRNTVDVSPVQRAQRQSWGFPVRRSIRRSRLWVSTSIGTRVAELHRRRLQFRRNADRSANSERFSTPPSCKSLAAHRSTAGTAHCTTATRLPGRAHDAEDRRRRPRRRDHDSSDRPHAGGTRRARARGDRRRSRSGGAGPGRSDPR